jgi:ABC-type branched-subunit amino acid transport system substrate-binding protein
MYLKLFTIFGFLVAFVGVTSSGVAFPIVGYGSSDAVLPATDQEMFFIGFELGLRHNLKRVLPKDFLLTKNVREDTLLGAAKTARALIDQKVSLAVGFPSSHEALLAAEVTAPTGTLFISSAAGHSKIAQMGPTVYSSSESMFTSNDLFLDFITRRFPNKKGLLISNPKSLYSREHAKTILTNAGSQAKYRTVHLVPVEIPPRQQPLSPAIVNAIVNGGFDYVYLTTYPDDSVEFLNLMETQNMQIPILSSTWTTAELDLLRRFLTTRKGPIYSSTAWLPKLKEAKDFEELVLKTYGKEATPEIGYGFDLGVIVAQILNRVKGEYTKESILAAFRSDLCFSGTSTGKLCFSPNGGQSTRQIFLVEYQKKRGFVLLKD